jgi:mRNA interferase RelE/StbE
MRIFFKPSFISDFKQLTSDTQKEVRYICTDIFPKLKSLRDFSLYPIKPIAGFKSYFRIKLNDHRIGFKKRPDGGIEFMRVKHRKDIYKHFP